MRIFRLGRNKPVEIPKSNMLVKGAPRNWTRSPRRPGLFPGNSANTPNPATANPKIERNEPTILLIQPNSLLPFRHLKLGVPYHINFAISTLMIEAITGLKTVRRLHDIELAPTKYQEGKFETITFITWRVQDVYCRMKRRHLIEYNDMSELD